jgi:hypothetical protein
VLPGPPAVPKRYVVMTVAVVGLVGVIAGHAAMVGPRTIAAVIRMLPIRSSLMLTFPTFSLLALVSLVAPSNESAMNFASGVTSTFSELRRIRFGRSSRLQGRILIRRGE